MDIKSLKLLSERNRKRLLDIIYNAGAGHTGGENDLTRDLSLCTEAAALEHTAVLQHKVNAAIHMLPPLLPALRLPEPFLTNPTH